LAGPGSAGADLSVRSRAALAGGEGEGGAEEVCWMVAKGRGRGCDLRDASHRIASSEVMAQGWCCQLALPLSIDGGREVIVE